MGRMAAHRYKFPYPVLFWVFNLSALYLLVGGTFWCIWTAIQDEPKILISLFLFFLPLGLTFLFFANIFPEIKVDDRGLLVRFSLGWFRVRWEDVMGISPGLIFDVSVVQTRSLSFFHRLYGLYGLSFSPSFVIKPRISNYRKLMNLIEMKLKMKSQELTGEDL